MIKKVNSFFPQHVQTSLLNLVSSEKFPWFYSPPPSYTKIPEIEELCKNDTNIKLVSGFQHTFYRKNKKQCNAFLNKKNLLDIFIDSTEKHFNIKVNEPLRLLSLLSLPNENYSSDSYLIPHVDYFTKHKTCLYYINDSDGDTFLFDEVFQKTNLFSNTITADKNFITKKTLSERITPTQGKAILFDGLRYHSGSIPKHNLRYVLNFNFK